MADETWQIAIAFGVQTALGTQNATIAALSGTKTEADGFVLGDRESGDANSGIVVPQFIREGRAAADVAGSFSRQASSFDRLSPTGLSITIHLKGNGVTSTPAAGQAKPDPGIDACLQAAGLVGVNGTSPVYEFTPRIGATSPPVRYLTAKLFIGGESWVLADLICESASVQILPGGTSLVTFNFGPAVHDPTSDKATGVTFPTVTYGNQTSLSAPTTQGVAFTWGSASPTDHGQNEFTLNITQDVSLEDDANQATGKRAVVNGRSFDVSGRIYTSSTDPDFEWQKTVGGSAPTEDMTLQIGTIAGATDTLNALKIEINNVELEDVSYDRQGAVMVAEITGHATAAAAGAEFKLTFN